MSSNNDNHFLKTFGITFIVTFVVLTCLILIFLAYIKFKWLPDRKNKKKNLDCTTDNDCTITNEPYCSEETNQCVQCTDNNQCPINKPNCDSDNNNNNTCICNNEENCDPLSNDKPICSNNICTNCQTHSNCFILPTSANDGSNYEYNLLYPDSSENRKAPYCSTSVSPTNNEKTCFTCNANNLSETNLSDAQAAYIRTCPPGYYCQVKDNRGSNTFANSQCSVGSCLTSLDCGPNQQCINSQCTPTYVKNNLDQEYFTYVPNATFLNENNQYCKIKSYNNVTHTDCANICHYSSDKDQQTFCSKYIFEPTSQISNYQKENNVPIGKCTLLMDCKPLKSKKYIEGTTIFSQRDNLIANNNTWVGYVTKPNYNTNCSIDESNSRYNCISNININELDDVKHHLLPQDKSNQVTLFPDINVATINKTVNPSIQYDNVSDVISCAKLCKRKYDQDVEDYIIEKQPVNCHNNTLYGQYTNSGICNCYINTPTVYLQQNIGLEPSTSIQFTNLCGS